VVGGAEVSAEALLDRYREAAARLGPRPASTIPRLLPRDIPLLIGYTTVGYTTAPAALGFVRRHRERLVFDSYVRIAGLSPAEPAK
jgi:hypothetical protein